MGRWPDLQRRASGRPGASIACPVVWSVVRPGLNHTGCPLPALLDASPPPDLWADFEAAWGGRHAAIVQATRT